RQPQAGGNDVDRPDVEPVWRSQEHRRDADREQVDGERPDHVHEPREQRVHEAGIEPRDERENGRDEAGDHRRADADLERAATAARATRFRRRRRNASAHGLRPATSAGPHWGTPACGSRATSAIVTHLTTGAGSLLRATPPRTPFYCLSHI